MAEERYDKSHHSGATPEARIAARLRFSGGEQDDHCVTKGSGPNRTITNIHSNAGQQRSHHTAQDRRTADPQAAMRKEGDNGR
jgi:hypothetical protein